MPTAAQRTTLSRRATMAQAIKNRMPLALLAEIQHPSGTVYYWTGIGLLEWEGKSFLGIGRLGTVTPVKNSSDIAIQEVNFVLTGADPAVVGQLSSDVRNRSGFVWLAATGEKGDVVATMLIVSALLDYQSFNIDENGAASITITARTGFYSLERALDEVWSAEDQYLTYPDDVGLDKISALQNQDLIWKPT